MELEALRIDPCIERAETLPGWVYGSAELYALGLERIFASAWLIGGAQDPPREPGELLPFELAPLGERLLWARDEQGALRCLSNVCTHRGMALVGEPCRAKALRCPYHGRRFGLDGAFRSMPEFTAAEGFPRPHDDLPQVAWGSQGPLCWVSLAPRVALGELLGPVRERTGWLPWGALSRDEAGARTYEVAANWALYCENYLEGFHVPYVHPSLNQALDYGAYRTELFPWATLQLGVVGPEEPAFELPAGHPDAGLRVGAFYFWLFPSTLVNVYPWGVSLNAVEPRGPAACAVRFVPYVWDAALRERGAGAGLDQVELEDEAVVEAVQRGVTGRLYGRGRYSPSREQGVHHFHRCLAAAWRGEPWPAEERA